MLRTRLLTVATSASILTSAALAAVPLSSPASGTGWQLEVSSNGSNPTARHEAAYVEFGGKFYLMGGRGARPVDEYDPVAKTWTNLGFPPLQMHHFQPVVHDGLVWSICAFEGNYPNETPVADIYTYDPLLNNWQVGSAIPPARNRGSAGAVVYDDKIYVVGGNTLGHNGGAVAWLDCYDPSTDSWTPLADAPHARDHFTAAVVGNKLIVAGGRQTEQPNPFLNTIAAVDVYDFSTGQWGNMPEPIPTERAGTMTVARGEHVIVVGGETTSQAHAETEALDVGTGEWTTLPALLDSRHSGGAVLHLDQIYVASGAGNNGGGPELTTQERLELAGLLPPSASNLISNADFDDGLTGWDDQGDLTLNADGNIAGPSLDVENGHTAQQIAVFEYETYRMTGAYELLGTTGAATLRMEYLDVNSIKIGEALLNAAPTSGFTSFTLTGTTPPGTRFIVARFDAGGDRTLRIDDLVLMDKPSEIARLGVPANPWALMPSTAGPVGGLIYNPSIDHTDFVPAATLDVLAIGFLPVNFNGGLGTVLIDLITPFFLNASPGADFFLPIPLDPFIVGIPFSVQAASVSMTETKLTNALDLTIQAP